jgi:hypothetical protein
VLRNLSDKEKQDIEAVLKLLREVGEASAANKCVPEAFDKAYELVAGRFSDDAFMDSLRGRAKEEKLNFWVNMLVNKHNMTIS